MKQLCPKCNGQKKVSIPPEIPGDIKEFTWGTTGPYECQVCEGTGMVETKFPPQPQQKEQFSREDMIGFANYCGDYGSFDEDGMIWSWRDYGTDKTTDQLLIEYLNSKTKPL